MKKSLLTKHLILIIITILTFLKGVYKNDHELTICSFLVLSVYVIFYLEAKKE